MEQGAIKSGFFSWVYYYTSLILATWKAETEEWLRLRPTWATSRSQYQKQNKTKPKPKQPQPKNTDCIGILIQINKSYKFLIYFPHQ